MGLIENAKDAAKLVQQIGNIELYEKLVSLQQDAMSILDENWKLKDEVRSLKEQLQQSQKLSEIDADMQFVPDPGFFIKKSEEKAGKYIPYCPVCWKSDRKDVPLNPTFGEGYYKCDIHKSAYETLRFRQLKNSPQRDTDSYF